MKLLIDVNLSPRVAAALRARGHDAVRVSDILDPRASDETIISDALRRGAVIVTRDQDFSMLLVTTGAAKPSIVNLRVSTVDADVLATLIDAIVQDRAADLEGGAIVTVDDRRVRIRRLPVA
jgi:predicted nuclease of predicted toxin-antitoxin system